jgi:DNA-binding transcriptional LysR family regulator
MLVRHLSYFVALAREQHFARAANACAISQPTLSAAIARLESDLSTPLVRRGRRFEGLTPEGERLLEWARGVVADYERLCGDLAGMRGRA